MQKKTTKRTLKTEGDPRLLMTKDGRRPLTPQGAGRRVVAVMKAAREQWIEAAKKARAIEAIIAAPKGKTVVYALRALLVELSNEGKVGVDSPGVAGAFYREVALDPDASTNIHVQQTLRHLDVLLSSPTVKTASTLIKYWDDTRSKPLKVDPFPAKPDPFASTTRKRKPKTR